MPRRSATNAKTGPAKLDPKADSRTKAKNVSATRRLSSEAVIEEQAARTQAPTSVQPVEPEDAYLTGVSRSLQRRLLGLNVGGHAKPIPGASVAGIHSTGSYTATQGVKPESSPKPAKGDKKK